MECNGQNVLSVWTIFCFPPPPPQTYLTTRKIKTLTKWKKCLVTLSFILSLILSCTINGNHMMYGSWEMEHDRQIFLSFWTIFCPFTLLTTQKIEILKKWKKSLEIYYFTHTYHKWKSWCMVPEKWSTTDRIFCHFGQFFSLLTP